MKRKQLPLDHEQTVVTETPDNPVTRQRDLERAKWEARIGLTIVTAVAGSPKVGGPTVSQATAFLAQQAGSAVSLTIAGLVATAGVIAAIRS